MPDDNETVDDQKDDKTDNDERRKRGRPKKTLSEDELKETKTKMQLTKLQNEKSVLRKQNEKCKQEIADIAARYANLQAEKNKLKGEFQKLLADHGMQMSTINDMSEQRMQMQIELDENAADLARMQKLLDDSKGEIKELKEISGAKLCTAKKELHQANINLQTSIEKGRKTEAEINKWKKRVDEMNEKLEEATQSLESSGGEAAKLRQLLSECESEKNELLEQLDNSVQSIPESGPKPRGIVLVDNVTKLVAEKLQASINWLPIKSSLDVPENVVTDLQRCDIVLFLTGSEDIRGGAKGVAVFSKLKSVINKIVGNTKVVVAELPPTTVRGAAAQVTLFNYKLAKITDSFPEVTFVATNPKAALKHELLDENDDLSENARCSIARELGCISPPDTIKPQGAANFTEASGCADPTYKLTELIQLQQKQIGRVIGAQGSNIIRLSKKHNVTLRIGKWSEPRRDNKNEMEGKMDGVIVSGLATNVKAAANEIRLITSKDAYDANQSTP
jgi:predicted  nucleic acid-binding Zn-ribbon protein